MEARENQRDFRRAVLRKQRQSERGTAMAEIINLRRARKEKARAAKSTDAEANRVKHGIAKPLRKRAREQQEKSARTVDAHKLDERK
jgi:hypothetical protein